jgi:hypothetical protein
MPDSTQTDSTQSVSLNIINTLQQILKLLTPDQQSALEDEADDIKSGINALAAATDEADDEAAKLLLKQDKMKGIVDAENKRIQRNIQTTETNLLTKKRTMNFTENKQLRTEQYNEMLYVFVLSLALIIIAVIAFRYFPFLPDFILQALILIVGSVGIIRIFNLYVNLQSRSHLNYNELKLDRPNVSSPEEVEQKQKAAAKSGDLLGSIDIGGCRAAACCDTTENSGVEWNESSRKCIKKEDVVTAEEFTVERMKYNKGIASPNSPSESNRYSKV